MEKLKILLCAGILSLTGLSTRKGEISPDRVKGKLIDSASGTPIANAYLYIVSGEEETLSNKDGLFEITTWQKFPLSIQILHDRYQDRKIAYQSPGVQPLIKLQLK